MATSRAQQISIWIIAAVLTVGTIGSFFILILQNDNNAYDQARKQELTDAYQKELNAYQAEVDAQTKELSKKYYKTFNQYADVPAAFTAKDVSKLTKRDLKVGTGATLTDESSFTAYYIGWNPKGKVFDSSIEDGALKAPIQAVPGGVISGWTEGAAGMKVGGVRELTIPAEKAYGSSGSGADIPADTPLKFIIMVIPTPKELSQPPFPEELLKYYSV